jgi:integrase/recombinase XerD
VRDGKARVPTPAELDRLFKLESLNPRNYAMLMISYGCGLRVSEIASLDLGHILNEDGTIITAFSLLKENTKTKKAREVYLSNVNVVKALEEYVAHLRSQGDVDLADPLFMSYRGARFHPNSLQQVFSWMYERAGLKGCRSHSGRRTFATRLGQANVDIKSIQNLMGHESIQQTATYIDTSPDVLKKVVEKVI